MSSQGQRLTDVESLQLFTASGYVPVDDQRDRMSYVGGIASVNGVEQQAVRVFHPMSSNGLTRHTTIEWLHPLDSSRRITCNCNGWTLKRRGSVRHCWHTDLMASDPGVGESAGTLNEVVSAQQLARHNARLQLVDAQPAREEDSQPQPPPPPPRRRRRQAATPPPPSHPDENLRHLDF